MTPHRILALALLLAACRSSRERAHEPSPPPDPADHADWVIPPGQERRVTALVAPLGLGAEVVPGWRLKGIAIERDRIDLGVVNGKESVVVTLVHASDDGEALARTASFKVRAPAGGAQPARAIAERLAALVAKNDRGGVWARPGE